MSATVAIHEGGDNNPEVDAELDVNYQPPPQKTIEEIMATDTDDESLKKYKEALLGAAQSEKIVIGIN